MTSDSPTTLHKTFRIPLEATEVIITHRPLPQPGQTDSIISVKSRADGDFIDECSFIMNLSARQLSTLITDSGWRTRQISTIYSAERGAITFFATPNTYAHDQENNS